MNGRLLRRVAPLLVALLLGLALWLLHRELRAYRYADIRRSLAGIPPLRVLLAAGLTILSYVVLTGYDTLALRYLHRRLPYRRTALASFVGFVFSHNVGLSVFGGAAPRYRLYSSWQLSNLEIATLVGFASLTFWIGSFTVGGLALVSEPLAIAHSLRLPPAAALPLGVLLLAAVAAYLAAGALHLGPFKVRGHTIALPGLPIAVRQLILSSADWAVAAAVLYVLLPPGSGISYLHFVGLFLAAEIAGLGSHVPGGLGVFEAVMLLSLPAAAGGAAVVGSLLVFRMIYYLLPLVGAAALLATHEVLERREKLAHLAAVFGRWVPEVAPRVLAVAVFAAGAILLFSGATPAVHGRLAFLNALVPLPLLEASHFLGSLAGLGLLLLASAIQRRLDAAYHFAVVLLGAGVAFSLLRGFDWEEALLLAAVLFCLLPCRHHFYRTTSLLREPFGPGWSMAVAVVVGGSLWLAYFAHRHVEYGSELWWQFSFEGDAPRSLRAGVGVVAASLVFAVIHLLRPARVAVAAPDRATLDVVREIVRRSSDSAANLALLGDKAFLFSEDRSAFVMYGSSGRSLVAMGDPVGPRERHRELVWRFRELCDRRGMWPVFYEATAAELPAYLDVGLYPMKFGEEARVRLDGFSLEGGAHKEQRHTMRRAEREGARFEVLPAGSAGGNLSELRRISDAWLKEKSTREKGFSLGAFVPPYLDNFPLAILRREERIVAFANVWCGAEKEELSPDLMRYAESAPHGAMEVLFLELMLWGKQQGFRWFNLGMAPLAGLEARDLAPLWHRLGAFTFRHGEHFYNFQGLRRYKEKFDPEWTPKYLVCPGGLALPRVLANVAALVSGGLKGIVAR